MPGRPGRWSVPRDAGCSPRGWRSRRDREWRRLISSSSQRRPRAIARTSVARVSARIGRWSGMFGLRRQDDLAPSPAVRSAPRGSAGQDMDHRCARHWLQRRRHLAARARSHWPRSRRVIAIVVESNDDTVDALLDQLAILARHRDRDGAHAVPAAPAARPGPPRPAAPSPPPRACPAPGRRRRSSGSARPACWHGSGSSGCRGRRTADPAAAPASPPAPGRSRDAAPSAAPARRRTARGSRMAACSPGLTLPR